MRGVYRIYNTINGKTYIGSSTNIEKRWQQHKTDLSTHSHHNKKLQNDWLLHGEDNFLFEVIEETPHNNLIEREQFHVNQYNFKRLYNVFRDVTKAPNRKSPRRLSPGEVT